MSTAEAAHEVAVEQAYVSALYDRLDTARRQADQALAELRRSPVVPTPAGRTERDSFDALYSDRIARLAAVEERLCFGRLDLVGGERRYIGRIGLSDETQAQLLLDWRAPAAAAFYQATAAAPEGVGRRRHIATTGRTVTGIDDELLDADLLGDAELTTVTGDGALMGALTAHRTGRMKDIVATLQAEQDEVVRSPLGGVLVVQGGPGTGKTAVALHRAAYLLYTHRDRVARSGVLLVGPSTVFLRYIEQVLPALGETGVVLSTPATLFPGVEATGTEPAEVATLKGDLRMARVIRAAVRARQRLLDQPVPIVLDGDRVRLLPKTVADARGRARQTGRPHNDARTTFVRHVLDDLARQLAEARRLPDDDDTRLDLLAELRDSVDVRREVNLCWMPLRAAQFVDRLLASPERLARAADGLLGPAEQRLLHRPEPLPWTPADVPLLDEAAELIGVDVAVTSERARAAARAAADRAERLEYARGVLQSGVADMMRPEVTAEMLADRFEHDGPSLTVAERARDDRGWAFGHVVVDEAQEISPMLWRLLSRRVPSRSMTVVGDLAQTGSAAGATSWAQALDPIAKGRWREAELTVNYRTPAVIMEPAAAMLTAAGVPVTPPRAAREGDHRPLADRLADRDPATAAEAAVAALRAGDATLDGGRFAVITARAGHLDLAAAIRGSLAADRPVRPRLAGLPAQGAEAPTGALTEAEADAVAARSEPLGERVSLLTVDEAKGLEFDGVVVVDPAAIVAESARGPNDLYVALSRPTQLLTVLHHDDLPAGLETLASPEPATSAAP